MNNISFILYILYFLLGKINKRLYNSKVSIVLFNIDTNIIKLGSKVLYKYIVN
jgi:hypothetical protein